MGCQIMKSFVLYSIKLEDIMLTFDVMLGPSQEQQCSDSILLFLITWNGSTIIFIVGLPSMHI